MPCKLYIYLGHLSSTVTQFLFIYIFSRLFFKEKIQAFNIIIVITLASVLLPSSPSLLLSEIIMLSVTFNSYGTLHIDHLVTRSYNLTNGHNSVRLFGKLMPLHRLMKEIPATSIHVSLSHSSLVTKNAGPNTLRYRNF